MTFVTALGRVGQIESALSAVTGTQPPITTAPSSGAAPSTATSPGMLSGNQSLSAGSAAATVLSEADMAGAEFEALMRVLSYSGPSTGQELSAGGGVAAASGSVSLPALGTAESVPNGGDAGEQLVETARKYLGVPYLWGGNDPRTGLDCSGLVKLALSELGVSMPRVAIDQARMGEEVPSLDEARPGDLIVTHEGGHIGIYVGEGQMIHAPRPGRSVAIDQVSHVTDSRGIMTIRRVVEDTAQSSSGTETSAVTLNSADQVAAERIMFEAAVGASERTSEGTQR